MVEMATPTINKIAGECKNSSFAYFTQDDIFQEVWRICLEALPKYDHSRNKLENFLRTCVSNRLRNLKRDKYFRPDRGFDPTGRRGVNDRIGIVNAIPIGICNVSNKDNMLAASSQTSCPPDPKSELIAKDMETYIVDNLTGRKRENFLRLLNGEHLSQEDKDSTREIVRDILEDYDG